MLSYIQTKGKYQGYVFLLFVSDCLFFSAIFTLILRFILRYFYYAYIYYFYLACIEFNIIVFKNI